MNNDYKRSATELTHVGDQLSLERAELLADTSEFRGLLVIERYTPRDEADIELPQLLMGQIAELRNPALGMSQPEVDARVFDLEAQLADMLSERLVTSNLITQVGDQYYGERASGIGGAPAQATGMKIGTGSTAASKTGAGAALVTYLAASNKVFDGGFPASSLNGSSRQIQWKVSWGAGVINGSALREVVITNDAAVDATSTAANTYSRALFGPMTLGVADTLAITWNHLLLGA